MKKVFLSLVLFCGLALISTSCNKDNNTVTPEVEEGAVTVGSKTMDIVASNAVKYGQQNAIVLTSKEMTAADNEGIAIIFNGDIVPGTYTIGEDTKSTVPQVVGLHEFNMGELPFLMGADTLYFGDTYFWVNGQLSITEDNGTYTVVLSQCVGTNANGHDVNMALNFNGTLPPYVFDTSNKFQIKDIESPIGLAGITTLNNLSSLGLDVVHVALDSDFLTFQPQTGYIAQSGTMKVVTNDDGTKTVIMENLKLKNVEHDNEFFFPVIDGSLQYHGYMYELSL